MKKNGIKKPGIVVLSAFPRVEHHAVRVDVKEKGFTFALKSGPV